ncbi:MAG TPA: hypothetical protein VJM69_05795 [Dehalococcoidia bacterium]|nr:hypothetical protein [Dehalococcoidia bacterium]
MAKFFECEYKPDGELTLRFRRPQVLSGDVRSHILESQKEMLLALRDVLDSLIQSVERHMEEPQPGRTEIKVE